MATRTSGMKKVNHDANQRGFNEAHNVTKSPSTTTLDKVGVTAPIQKPSSSTLKKPGITGPKC